MAVKLNYERTWITTMRKHYLTLATFLNPLYSTVLIGDYRDVLYNVHMQNRKCFTVVP
jgi:hypothetical protein